MKDRTKRRKFNRNYRPHFKLGKYSFGFVVLALILVISLLYLSQSNKIAIRGYDIAELEKQKQELLAEKERLEIESSRLQSIQEIEKGLKNSGMVPVKKINYVTTSSTVALNR
jgi:Tfp pilus assembly protein PilN